MRPDVPEQLDELVARMLSKHPAVRPADGSAVARELSVMVTIGPEGPRRTASREVRALTGGERRLVSIVMGAPRIGMLEPDAPTMSAHTVDASSDRLYAVTAPFGAQLECLADGTIVVTVMGRRSATDQAAHAARCALALRKHIPSAPMSLATGLAVVTDRFLSGDVLDRAADLLLRAQEREQQRERGAPGNADITPPIRLDETTAGLLDSRFDVGGDTSGLALFGQRAEGSPTRTLLGKETPFVGRDRELDSLVAIFEECAKEPVARAVLVTAAAGIGKTRLIHELVRQVKARSDSAQVWIARGDPMSEGSPFTMLGQAVRSAASIHESEPHVVRQQKLRARLGRHLSGERLARVAEFLGELAGTPFSDNTSVQLRSARHDAMLMGDQMRRAWEDWISAECAAAPVLLVLEDLQWGDLPSVKFIESALRNFEESPLMVLAVARPDVHEVFPQLWSERGLQEVRLGALTRRAAERLVREVLGPDATASSVTGLIERAAGNAFYLEELIRAVADGRGAELPETVLAMVETRLERLDPDARRVLRAASVFGQVFARTGLLALLGGERKTSEVDEWLEDLASREVVTRRGGGKLPGDHEYAFRHALVREAAYAMLTSEDRALGHRLAGEWLEQCGESEPIVLAEHFERGGLPVRAIEWYRRAAVQALEGNDLEATMDRAERALACGAAGATRGALRLLQAEASNWRGKQPEAEALGLEAMEALPRGSEDWFLAGAQIASASWRLGHSERLIDLAQEFGSIDADSMITPGRCIASARLASRLYFRGLVEGADALLGWVEVAAQPFVLERPQVAAWLHHVQALRATLGGDTEREIELLELALRCFEDTGDVRNACGVRNDLSVALTYFGLYESAETHLRYQLDVAQRVGLLGVALEAKQNLGTVLSRCNRFAESIAVQREAIAGFHAAGDAVMEAASRAYLAMACLRTGDKEEAYREAVAAVSAVETIAPLYAGGLAILATIQIERGRTEEALEAATLSMQYLVEVGSVTEGESLIRLGYAEALEAAGKTDLSIAAFADAREMLLARAARIRNPAWRRSFLDRVRENVRTLARAGELVR
jgi:tetratricopeptide (TPR) repeat protein